MTSINTNQSAMVALETLRGINSKLSTLNDQISTGKKVNSAKDNAAIWSIAKTMDSDVMSFNAVTDSLGLAQSTIGVARTAAETITDLLIEVKSKITDSSNKNTEDRAKIQTDITDLTNQITDIVEAAQFNGVNLLDNGDAVSYLSSFNRDSAGTVTSDTIAVNGQNLTTDAAVAGVFGTDPAVTGVTLGSGTIDASSSAQTDEVVFSLDSSATINAGDNFRVTLGGTNFDYEAEAGDNAAAVIAGLVGEITGAPPSNTSNIESGTSGSDLTIELDLASGTLAVTGNSAQASTAGGGLAALSDISVADETATGEALTSIESLISVATSAAASLGSSERRIEIQSEFVINLVDSLELGISTLTDTDLSAASAELQSLQVQQQLGLQSLSIANQNPQTVLSLFR